MPSDLVISIIAAEELARETNQNTKEVFKKFRTYIIDWKDFIINPAEGTYIFLEKAGEGKIEEIVIVSPTNNFSLFIEVDGTMAYQGGFSRYQEVSAHINSIVAQQRGTKYILQINDVVFSNHIMVIIDAGEQITFNRLHCKYQLAE